MTEKKVLNIKRYAKIFAANGFSVIPTYSSGEYWKAPKQKTVEKNKKSIQKNHDLFDESCGIGVFCGEVSGNLECIDFDNHFDDIEKIFHEFMSIGEISDIIASNDLVIEETVRGGFHVVYRCTDKIGPGRKLARRIEIESGKPKTLIETRSEGQYFVAAPSVGYLVTAGSFADMKTITPTQRDILLNFAKTFNEYVKDDTPKSKAKESDSERPGDLFNSDPNSIEEVKGILTVNGWKSVGGSDKYWRRPGKESGVSATLGHIAPGIFYVFSSNAAPLEDLKAYNPFQIFAILGHGGNFNDAAMELRSRGLGRPVEKLTKKEKASKDFYGMIFQLLHEGRDFDENDVADLAKQFKHTKDFVRKQFNFIYDNNASELGLANKSDMTKAKAYIRKNWNIRINEITTGEEVRRHDGANLNYNISDIYIDCRENGQKIKLSDFRELMLSNFVERFNPFKEYFETLEPYNMDTEPDYIHDLSKYFKCEDPDSQDFFSNMFKKHVVRHLYCSLDGIENRYVFMLIGPQEDGKSSFIRYLCFADEYFTESSIVDGNDKDIRTALFENFIWNLEEFSNSDPRQTAKIKAAISKRVDKIRVVWGRRAEKRLRVVNFWASADKDDILTDEAGNSRYLVFKGKIISHEYCNYSTKTTKIPIDRVWAQAYYLYKECDEFEAQLSKEEKIRRDSMNLQFEVISNVDSLIQMIFKPAKAEQLYFWPNAKIEIALQTKAPRMNISPHKISGGFNRINRQIDVPENRFIKHHSGTQRGWFLSVVDSAVEDKMNSDPNYTEQEGH